MSSSSYDNKHHAVTWKRMNLLSGNIDEKGFPGSKPNSPKKTRYNFNESEVEQEYISDIQHMFDVVKDRSVFEIAVGNCARLTPIYNHYGVKSLFGIEPFDRWYNQSKEILEIYAEFDWKILCSRYEDCKPPEVDVVVCCGLAYHLHSPYHLFEYLANINAEYIIMETTGVSAQSDNPDWSGEIGVDSAMERIKGIMQEHQQSFNDYIMIKSQMFSTYEEQNIPGNSINNNRRSIPWNNSGLNPDVIVLAFWCMGYDLDKSHERIGGGDKSKACNTVYRFKKSEDTNRDPRLLAQYSQYEYNLGSNAY